MLQNMRRVRRPPTSTNQITAGRPVGISPHPWEQALLGVFQHDGVLVKFE